MMIGVVGVVGAGQMGHGIAQVAAMAGYRVCLYDIAQEVLEKAYATIRGNLEKGVSLGKVRAEVKEQALSLIQLTTDLGEVAAQSDLIIEAVPEDMKLKLEIFQMLDQKAKPEAILASNTSSLSITELGGATKRPDRVVGMHFFNPVHLMRLVEVVKGLETSQETLDLVQEMARKMGKETVVINDFPGFATSRISAMLGNEAFYMLMEGVGKPEDIDKALKLGLNLPMGPLELGDLVGLDTRLKVLEHLHATLGEKYRPCPLLVKYVKAGRLGRKTGKGVYDYTTGSQS